MKQDLRQFGTLVEIMAKLRGPGGCPWDQEQTHLSLAPYAIEEASELSEAIHDGEDGAVIEELGDLLLQVVFHAELGRESGRFTIEDVVESISSKLIRRHPHVFADVKVENSEDVTRNWEKIKAAEKEKKKRSGRMDVPLGLPALQRAQKIGDRTKKEKFDWKNALEVFAKLQEEIRELEAELSASGGAATSAGTGATAGKAGTAGAAGSAGATGPGDARDAIRMEVGDVLFTAAQLARHLKLDAEQTLRETNQRFETRYLHMRGLAEREGKDWATLPDAEKEAYWQKAKAATK
ncbi:MAG TPA: nucleoside triphosphate pyrophosphohydrolase [Bdellovibrionales bacterium]|nr:nucleoside triphosphate pyrophosphohydrolase [Bdellovibrionales bacterium]